MRVEVAYRGRIEAFDTDRFTEAQPFSGKSMLADLTLDYADVEKKGLWLTAHCYAANEAYRTDGGEAPEARREKGWRFQLATPREAAGIESVTLDGSTVLVRLSGYLANDDERLAASQALMAEAVGVTPLTLERAVEAEAAQEVPADDMEDDWMEGFGND